KQKHLQPSDGKSGSFSTARVKRNVNKMLKTDEDNYPCQNDRTDNPIEVAPLNSQHGAKEQAVEVAAVRSLQIEAEDAEGEAPRQQDRKGGVGFQTCGAAQQSDNRGGRKAEQQCTCLQRPAQIHGECKPAK